MASTLQTSLPPMELNAVDNGRRAANATTGVSQGRSIALIAVVKDALIRHYGSLKAAAISMEMDQAQLTRELQTGDFKFKKLEDDDAVKLLIARGMYDAFGDTDPKARRRRVVRELRSRLDELAELIEVA